LRRALAETRRANVPGVGVVELDARPDVALATTLSAGLDLCPDRAVALLLRAHAAGDLSVHRAAGIFFAERSSELGSLAASLRAEAAGAAHPAGPLREPATGAPTAALATLGRLNDQLCPSEGAAAERGPAVEALLRGLLACHAEGLRRAQGDDRPSSDALAQDGPSRAPADREAARVAAAEARAADAAAGALVDGLCVVTDAEGAETDIDLLWLREASVAADAVFHLCFLRPHAARAPRGSADVSAEDANEDVNAWPPPGAGPLVRSSAGDLLLDAAARAEVAADGWGRAGPRGAAAARQAALLLLAALCSLLPPRGGADQGAAVAAARADVDRHVREVAAPRVDEAAEAALASAMGSLPAGGVTDPLAHAPGLRACLHLAIGALAGAREDLAAGPDGAAPPAAAAEPVAQGGHAASAALARLASARRGRAFAHLRDRVFGPSAGWLDETPETRDLAWQAGHALLLSVLDTSAGAGLVEAMADDAAAQTKRIGGWCAPGPSIAGDDVDDVDADDADHLEGGGGAGGVLTADEATGGGVPSPLAAAASRALFGPVSSVTTFADAPRPPPPGPGDGPGGPAAALAAALARCELPPRSARVPSWTADAAIGALHRDRGALPWGDSLPGLSLLLGSLLGWHLPERGGVSPSRHLAAGPYLPALRLAERVGSRAPAVAVGHLGLLALLARGSEDGARWAAGWLATTPGGWGWEQFFGFLHAYCDRFEAASGGGDVSAVVPPEDAACLAAFAECLTATAEGGRGALVDEDGPARGPTGEPLGRAGVVTDGGDAGDEAIDVDNAASGPGPPALEILRGSLERAGRRRRPWDCALIDLACHRVPPLLKGSLLRAVGALACRPVRRPLADPAAALARLAAAGILRSDSAPGPHARGWGAGAAREPAASSAALAALDGYDGAGDGGDLRAQLELVEAREGRYGETLAVLRLVPALMASAARQESPSDAGRGSSPDDESVMPPPLSAEALLRFTSFALGPVLGGLHTRPHADPAERWRVAEAAFVHLAACVREALAAPGGGSWARAARAESAARREADISAAPTAGAWDGGGASAANVRGGGGVGGSFPTIDPWGPDAPAGRVMADLLGGGPARAEAIRAATFPAYRLAALREGGGMSSGSTALDPAARTWLGAGAGGGEGEAREAAALAALDLLAAGLEADATFRGVGAGVAEPGGGPVAGSGSNSSLRSSRAPLLCARRFESNGSSPGGASSVPAASGSYAMHGALVSAAWGSPPPCTGPLFPPMCRALLAQRGAVPRLLGLTGYPHEPALQSASLSLLVQLAGRTPHLVALVDRDGGPGAADALTAGVARALASGLAARAAERDTESAAIGRAVAAGHLATIPTAAPDCAWSGDSRPRLALEALAASLLGPAPTLAHLCLGFSPDPAACAARGPRTPWCPPPPHDDNDDDDAIMAGPRRLPPTPATCLPTILQSLPSLFRDDPALGLAGIAIVEAALVGRGCPGPGARRASLDALRRWDAAGAASSAAVATAAGASPTEAARAGRRGAPMAVLWAEASGACAALSSPAAAVAWCGPVASRSAADVWLLSTAAGRACARERAACLLRLFTADLFWGDGAPEEAGGAADGAPGEDGVSAPRRLRPARERWLALAAMGIGGGSSGGDGAMDDDAITGTGGNLSSPLARFLSGAVAPPGPAPAPGGLLSAALADQWPGGGHGPTWRSAARAVVEAVVGRRLSARGGPWRIVAPGSDAWLPALPPGPPAARSAAATRRASVVALLGGPGLPGPDGGGEIAYADVHHQSVLGLGLSSAAEPGTMGGWPRVESGGYGRDDDPADGSGAGDADLCLDEGLLRSLWERALGGAGRTACAASVNAADDDAAEAAAWREAREWARGVAEREGEAAARLRLAGAWRRACEGVFCLRRGEVCRAVARAADEAAGRFGGGRGNDDGVRAVASSAARLATDVAAALASGADAVSFGPGGAGGADDATMGGPSSLYDGGEDDDPRPTAAQLSGALLALAAATSETARACPAPSLGDDNDDIGALRGGAPVGALPPNDALVLLDAALSIDAGAVARRAGGAGAALPAAAAAAAAGDIGVGGAAEEAAAAGAARAHAAATARAAQALESVLWAAAAAAEAADAAAPGGSGWASAVSDLTGADAAAASGIGVGGSGGGPGSPGGRGAVRDARRLDALLIRRAPGALAAAAAAVLAPVSASAPDGARAAALRLVSTLLRLAPGPDAAARLADAACQTGLPRALLKALTGGDGEGAMAALALTRAVGPSGVAVAGTASATATLAGPAAPPLAALALLQSLAACPGSASSTGTGDGLSGGARRLHAQAALRHLGNLAALDATPHPPPPPGAGSAAGRDAVPGAGPKGWGDEPAGGLAWGGRDADGWDWERDADDAAAAACANGSTGDGGLSASLHHATAADDPGGGGGLDGHEGSGGLLLDHHGHSGHPQGPARPPTLGAPPAGPRAVRAAALLPALRLAVAVVRALPTSQDVRADGLRLIARRAPALVRCLAEAADPRSAAAPGAGPREGLEVVEAATLTASLCASLAPLSHADTDTDDRGGGAGEAAALASVGEAATALAARLLGGRPEGRWAAAARRALDAGGRDRDGGAALNDIGGGDAPATLSRLWAVRGAAARLDGLLWQLRAELAAWVSAEASRGALQLPASAAAPGALDARALADTMRAAGQSLGRLASRSARLSAALGPGAGTRALDDDARAWIVRESAAWPPPDDVAGGAAAAARDVDAGGATALDETDDAAAAAASGVARRSLVAPPAGPRAARLAAVAARSAAARELASTEAARDDVLACAAALARALCACASRVASASAAEAEAEARGEVGVGGAAAVFGAEVDEGGGFGGFGGFGSGGGGGGPADPRLAALLGGGGDGRTAREELALLRRLLPPALQAVAARRDAPGGGWTVGGHPVGRGAAAWASAAALADWGRATRDLVRSSQ